MNIMPRFIYLQLTSALRKIHQDPNNADNTRIEEARAQLIKLTRFPIMDAYFPQLKNDILQFCDYIDFYSDNYGLGADFLVYIINITNNPVEYGGYSELFYSFLLFTRTVQEDYTPQMKQFLNICERSNLKPIRNVKQLMDNFPHLRDLNAQHGYPSRACVSWFILDALKRASNKPDLYQALVNFTRKKQYNFTRHDGKVSSYYLTQYFELAEHAIIDFSKHAATLVESGWNSSRHLIPEKFWTMLTFALSVDSSNPNFKPGMRIPILKALMNTIRQYQSDDFASIIRRIFANPDEAHSSPVYLYLLDRLLNEEPYLLPLYCINDLNITCISIDQCNSSEYSFTSHSAYRQLQHLLSILANKDTDAFVEYAGLAEYIRLPMNIKIALSNIGNEASPDTPAQTCALQDMLLSELKDEKPDHNLRLADAFMRFERDRKWRLSESIKQFIRDTKSSNDTFHKIEYAIGLIFSDSSISLFKRVLRGSHADSLSYLFASENDRANDSPLVTETSLDVFRLLLKYEIERFDKSMKLYHPNSYIEMRVYEGRLHRYIASLLNITKEPLPFELEPIIFTENEHRQLQILIANLQRINHKIITFVITDVTQNNHFTIDPHRMFQSDPPIKHAYLPEAFLRAYPCIEYASDDDEVLWSTSGRKRKQLCSTPNSKVQVIEATDPRVISKWEIHSAPSSTESKSPERHRVERP